VIEPFSTLDPQKPYPRHPPTHVHPQALYAPFCIVAGLEVRNRVELFGRILVWFLGVKSAKRLNHWKFVRHSIEINRMDTHSGETNLLQRAKNGL